jgi:hypothetical protein
MGHFFISKKYIKQTDIGHVLAFGFCQFVVALGCPPFWPHSSPFPPMAFPVERTPLLPTDLDGQFDVDWWMWPSRHFSSSVAIMEKIKQNSSFPYGLYLLKLLMLLLELTNKLAQLATQLLPNLFSIEAFWHWQRH